MNEKFTVNGEKEKETESGMEDVFRCEECGRTFSAKQNLGAHIRRSHKNEPHVCPEVGCGKAYKQRLVKIVFY